MTIPDRYLDYAPWAIATLLIAAIVHVVSVLLMPTLAPRDAFARLSAYATAAKANESLFVLPAPAPGAEVLPYEDPDTIVGVCVYDLTKGLLHVSGPVNGEDYLALSLHARSGRIFHALTDRSAIKGKIDILIGDERQIEAVNNADVEGVKPQEVRVTAPMRRGFLIVRSLAKRLSDTPRARAAIDAFKCERRDPPKE